MVSGIRFFNCCYFVSKKIKIIRMFSINIAHKSTRVRHPAEDAELRINNSEHDDRYHVYTTYKESMSVRHVDRS